MHFFLFHSSSRSPTLWPLSSKTELLVSIETGTGKGRLIFRHKMDGMKPSPHFHTAQLTVWFIWYSDRLSWRDAVISSDVPLHFPLWVYPTYFYFSLKEEAWCTAKIHCYVRLNSYWILLAEKSAFRYLTLQKCSINTTLYVQFCFGYVV